MGHGRVEGTALAYTEASYCEAKCFVRARAKGLGQNSLPRCLLICCEGAIWFEDPSLRSG